jgi:hypothetical protein
VTGMFKSPFSTLDLKFHDPRMLLLSMTSDICFMEIGSTLLGGLLW